MKKYLLILLFTLFIPSQAFAQNDPCVAETTKCGQPSYANCSNVKYEPDGRAYYTCTQSNNPNCVGTIYCATENKSTVPSSTPVPASAVCTPNAFDSSLCRRCASDGRFWGENGSDFGSNYGSSAWCNCAKQYNPDTYQQSCQPKPTASSQLPTAPPLLTATNPTPQQPIAPPQPTSPSSTQPLSQSSSTSAPKKPVRIRVEQGGKIIATLDPSANLNSIKLSLDEPNTTLKNNIVFWVDYDYFNKNSVPFLIKFDVKPKTTTSFTDQQKSTDTSYDMGVLVLKYFPLTADGKNIDIKVTGDVGDSYQEVRQRTIDATPAVLNAIERATTYLGYKDPNAQPALRYSILDTKEYTKPAPFDPKTRRMLYKKIMEDHNICDWVDNKGVREVWIWAYQGPSVFPNPDDPTNDPDKKLSYLGIWEGTMQPIKQAWFIANGGYENMPVCKHTYFVYTFNEGRGAGMAFHSWDHQIEYELRSIDNHLVSDLFQGPQYPACNPATNTIDLNGDNKIDSKDQQLCAKNRGNAVGRCGSVHNPPNSIREYDYWNPKSWQSDCLDWNPDSPGKLTNIDCSIWGCTDKNSVTDSADLEYMIWNLQNMPGRNNGKTYQGQRLRNWWDVHGNFDNVMKNNRALAIPSTKFTTLSTKRQNDSVNDNVSEDTKFVPYTHTENIARDGSMESVKTLSTQDLQIPEPTPAPLKLIDFNNDGQINVFDYIIFAQKKLGS